jgi:UDPglucose 6-dehydrogenase
VKISVYGLGKLGLPLASVLQEAGHEVTGIDPSAMTIGRIRDRRQPALPHEPGVNPTGLAITRYAQAADMSFVVVPTPSYDNVDRAGFSPVFVMDALRNIENVNDLGHIAVVVSTTSPGTMEDLAQTFRRLELVYNPTFIALGRVVEGLTDPDLLLLGGDTRPTRKVREFWLEIIDQHGNCTPVIHEADYTEIELIKLAVNAVLGTKISLANSLGELFEAWDVDPKAVEIVGKDPRIGSALMTPGGPISGPCLPRDNRALQFAAAQKNLHLPLSSATDTINENVKQSILHDALVDDPSSVGILGMSYKYGVDVDTDALGPWLQKALEARGVAVSTYDELMGGDLSKVLACHVVVIAQPEYRVMVNVGLRVNAGLRGIVEVWS